MYFFYLVTWNSPSNGATETLAEDRTVGSVIVTLNATASNTIIYVIVSQTPPEDKFGIDNTNELYLKAELDYETTSLYDVKIRALDNLASGQADITLTITVTDVNDNAPVIASDTSSDLPTNTAVGSIVFVVTAADVDTVGTVTYSITSGNVNHDFSINAMTGEITLNNALDINTTPEYDIGIEATDGVNSVTQTITFYVNDVIWRTPKDGQTDILAENTPIDTTVITLQADNSVIYSFTLLKLAAEESKFRIEGGALKLKESLDYEITKSYTFTLKALKSSSLSAVITYNVNITDVNDEPPVFSSATSLDLSKDTDIGSVVYTAEVTDPDTVGSSTFLIASGNTNADFSINTTTGDLTLDKALDPNVTQTYSLVVEATVIVNKTFVNICVLVAWTEPEKGTIDELPEDIAVNTVIQNRTAETATSYIIRDQIPYPEQFGIIINTNELVLVSELDYENTTTHIISLRALDGSGKSADISYIVNVIDVNDLEPEFVSDTFEVIPENTPVGNTIYTASATDDDTVGTVSYSITGGNTNTSFKINTTAGDLTLDKALDPDVTLTYSLVIEATDSEFTVTMTLSIAVNRGTSLGECNYPSYCGPHCELSCQDGCVSQHCNQSCDCVKGCNSNYWGEKCKTPCSASCNKPIDDSIATCDSSNGTCLSGINENKFWDNHCDTSCSDGCLHRKCQQESGYCTEG
ncbi:protocadherin Fat 4-like [Mercenaria mercenaria]|uniref:protocadherin Fat 4-like n=1 Tax=Mercenaria mercenaria TaxID=6596 RepID=UPI00234EDF2B|nr:protocadherin Fat 4-like [Mercenaria mercenaria]